MGLGAVLKAAVLHANGRVVQSILSSVEFKLDFGGKILIYF